jgi:hypothetical protein
MGYTYALRRHVRLDDVIAMKASKAQQPAIVPSRATPGFRSVRKTTVDRVVAA